MASAGQAGNGRPVYVVEFRFSRDVKGCIDNLTRSMSTRLGLAIRDAVLLDFKAS